MAPTVTSLTLLHKATNPCLSESKMFLLEILVHGYWESVAEVFESAHDAELYYRHQVSGCEDYRIVEEV